KGAAADGNGKLLVDQLAQEVSCLLAMDDAGEGAVLTLEKDARVQHDRHQKPRLPLAEAESLDRSRALVGDHGEVPVIGRLKGVHRNSSAILGCGVPPPFPPF